MATVTRTIPQFETDDLDRFESRLERYLEGATARDLSLLVVAALQYIEKRAENAGPETFRYEGWTYLNNATSAIAHVTNIFKARLDK